MAEEVKKAIEEMVRASEGNKEAQMLLKGIKLGMECVGAIKKEAEE